MKHIKRFDYRNIFWITPLCFLLFNSCEEEGDVDIPFGKLIIEISNEKNIDESFSITMDNYSYGSILANKNVTVTGDYCIDTQGAESTQNVEVLDQVWPGQHTLTLTSLETQSVLLTSEFEMTDNGCLVLPIVLQYPEGSINLEGIWIMDLTLAEFGYCDETHLEDEAHIPPTFHFNNNGTLTFDTDPVDSDLNNLTFFRNTYALSGNALRIQSVYIDENQTDIFDANLTFSDGQFTGTYIMMWDGSEVCTNSLVVSRQ